MIPRSVISHLFIMESKLIRFVIFLVILAVFVDIAHGWDMSAAAPGETGAPSWSHINPANAEGPSDGQIKKTYLRKIVVAPSIEATTSGVIMKTSLSSTPPPPDPVSAIITSTAQGLITPTGKDLQEIGMTSDAIVTSLPSTTTTYDEGDSSGSSTTRRQYKKIFVPRGNFRTLRINAGLPHPKKGGEIPSPEIETDFDRDLKTLRLIAGSKNIHGRKINAGLQYPKKIEETPVYLKELLPAPPYNEEEEDYPWMRDTRSKVSTKLSARKIRIMDTTSVIATNIPVVPVPAAPGPEIPAPTTTVVSADSNLGNIIIISIAVSVPLLLIAVLLFLVLLKLQRIKELLERNNV